LCACTGVLLCFSVTFGKKPQVCVLLATLALRRKILFIWWRQRRSARSTMTVLCPACQELVDENPIGVLGRRDENFILCQPCRQRIWRTNERTAEGCVAFVYHNPARESCVVQSLPPPEAAARVNTWIKWECRKCSKRVFARPRSYEGDKEPEDWWWCRSCKAAAPVKQAARPAKKAKARGTELPQRPNPTLDGWLRAR